MPIEDEVQDMTFNARQVIGLLEQAEIGCHALFDPQLIRDALENSRVSDVDLDNDTIEDIQTAIVVLAGMEKVDEQREYIQTLPLDVQNLLVHLYFRFLDQFMHRREITFH